MLKNYIVTAWKVFLRRKLFTFINLFGISLTLTIIMVASSIVESFLYPIGPEKNSANYLIVERLTLTNEEKNQTHRGRLGFKFIEDNIMRLQSPEIISLNTGAFKVAIYHQEQKVEKSFRRIDANYWDVFDFNFTSGRSFDQEEFERGQFLAVINEQFEQEMFKSESAIGRDIVVNNQSFRVIGVVENVSEVEVHASADIWVPYTTMASTIYKQQSSGSWEAILYHSDQEQLNQIRSEFNNMLKNDLVIENKDGMIFAFGGAFSKLENISNKLFADEHSNESGIEILFLIISLMIFLFMLLPSINMINLNVSRIMERSSEIGVRKAFGASANQLVSQFIVESILISFVGGFIGLIITYYLLQIIESSGLIPYAEFTMNWRILLWSVVMIVTFGLISGAYPAIKMSRLNPVVALKGGA